MDKNERAAQLLARRPRVFWGRVVAAIVREGWNPPVPTNAIAERLLDDLDRIPRETSNATLELGRRERECLVLVAEGLSYRETGERLGLGSETVKQYLDRVRVKLGARNSTHAVAIAIRDGLI